MAWQQLVDMIEEGRDLDRVNATKIPVECPNDYTALTNGPDGALFCPWDGWQYPQDA